MVLVQGICVWRGTCVHGDVATLFHALVKGATVNNHVLDYWVSSGAERLQAHGVAIGHLDSTLLASRSALSRTVSSAIDGQNTGTTDAFTAVRGESEWFFAALNKLVGDVVQNFED